MVHSLLGVTALSLDPRPPGARASPHGLAVEARDLSFTRVTARALENEAIIDACPRRV
jgi:hypothetical protein